MSAYKSLKDQSTFLSPHKDALAFAADVCEARKAIRYDPDSGSFTWLRDQKYKFRAGDSAGCVNRTNGYIQISINGVLIKAHRLAWVLVTGIWPLGTVDHVNGDRLDNRWRNLRDVPGAVNNQNQRRAHRDSLSGKLGVITAPRANGRTKYVARICVNRRHVRLGVYETADIAHAVYLKEKRKLHEGCTL